MKIMVGLALLGLLTLPLPAPAGEMDAAKEADIRRLIELAGGEQGVRSMLAAIDQQLMQIVQQRLPENESGARVREILQAMSKKFNERFDYEEFLTLLLPIYDRHFTHEDVRELIEFYQSPLGQRILRVMPVVFQESFAVGAEWGQKQMHGVMRELEAEFPELRPPQP